MTQPPLSRQLKDWEEELGKQLLIHYHIYSGDTERVMEKLDKGLIDFGLFVGEADISK